MPSKYSETQRVIAFWARVDKSGPIPEHRPDLGPCWLWTGSRQKRGYGMVRGADGRTWLAHRVAYLLKWGAIPDDRELDHLCRTHPCVRDSHLDPVPHVVNVRRGVGSVSVVNASKTHCVHGHVFTPENTSRVDGYRRCITCRRKSPRYRSTVYRAVRGAV